MAEKEHRLLTPDEMDAIGEIMNISMGSAATAVSTMLEKQVTITTPQLEQGQFKKIDCSNLEPALIVKIKYVEGITGTNVTMLRRHDMQVILELLMGSDGGDSDDFEFDDMSMSAACEVMNQMMGASSTALSEILDIPINISTPEAILVETKDEIQSTFFDLQDNDSVIAISFKMMIKDVLDTTFSCFLTAELASRIVSQVTDGVAELEPDPIPQMAPPPQPQYQEPMQQQAPQAPYMEQPQQSPNMEQPQQQAPYMQQPQQQAPPMQPQPQQQPYPPQQSAAPQPYQAPPFTSDTQRPPAQFAPQPDPAAQQNAYGASYGQYPPQYPPQQPYPPYGQAPYGYPQPSYGQQNMNLKNAEFPDFSRQPIRANSPSGSNMNLLMGVQLDVSVIIGRAKRKIKEIMDFGQGTVIELDKQTGSPAEIMVNGQLLAYGDVIVVGDNFGIRITEIVGTKDLLDSLDPSQK